MYRLFKRLCAVVSVLIDALSGTGPGGCGTPEDARNREYLREAKFILETQLLPKIQGGKLSAEDRAAFCRVMLLLHEAGAFDPCTNR